MIIMKIEWGINKKITREFPSEGSSMIKNDK